jgi:choloylglycine hydrolase
VNVRSVEKTVLDWKGDWPVLSEKPTTSWRSRYGSVTFTSYGRDFIEGGMNEAGLIVDETNLIAVYPPEDDRPGISCAQWMQYQLDNFATVDEVLAHLDDLRPDGEGWHYLIADATGKCAVIEYLKGTAVVYTADELEVCALSNTTYRQALSHIPMDKAFGGDIDISSGSDAYGRFLRMTILIKAFDPEKHGPARDYAFTILDDVAGEETLRSVVYDAPARKVLWRTRSDNSIRWLDLSSLDFSPSAPTRIIDVETGGPGDVSSKLTEYSIEQNRQLVRGVRDSGERSEATIRLLAGRELTYDMALELIALHPTNGEKRGSGLSK